MDTTMQLKQLLNDDDAVSPVIGVILMVAITVILAAVIGTFVLGLGDQVQTTAPNGNFEFDFAEDGAASTLDVTHSGGDGIESNELYLRGDIQTHNGGDLSWADHGYADETVRAGSNVQVNSTTSGYSWTDGGSGPEYEEGDTVRVVWEDSDSDQSSTLRTWSQN